jgi:cystathionine gamma-synthase
MAGFGGVVSFEIDGDFAATGRFVDRLHLPYIGPTLGGVESIVEQPAALFSLDPEERRKAGLKDNLVRYALGIEDADDLIADLNEALAGVLAEDGAPGAKGTGHRPSSAPEIEGLPRHPETIRGG